MGWGFLGFGTEESTPRSGPLSSWMEWHALIIGLAVGVIAAVAGRPILGAALAGVAFGVGGRGKSARQLRREGWTGLVGWIIGYGVLALA